MVAKRSLLIMEKRKSLTCSLLVDSDLEISSRYCWWKIYW